MKYFSIYIILFLSLLVTTGNAQDFAHIIPDKFKLKTLVIDAGHGGHDSGTVGAIHKEKDIALDVAIRFGKMVEQHHPDVEVIYTRKTDKFIPLKERAAIANRNDADLFISIHCNGGSHTASGSETYVLGLHRSEDNLKVAMRENNSILLEDNYMHSYGQFDPTSPEAYILFNLFQNAHLDQSLNLASTIESEFKGKGRKSRGVKQAGFLVLRETTMPSILIETGFLTNRTEERYMSTNTGKQQMAESIFKAFGKYKTILDTEAKRILMENAEARAQIEAEQKRKEEERKRKQESHWAWPSMRTIPLSGQQYFVQLMVSKSYDKGEEVFPFKETKMERIEVIDSYKYLIGPYSTETEAKVAHKKAQEKGFRDAYILKYSDGKLVR